MLEPIAVVTSHPLLYCEVDCTCFINLQVLYSTLGASFTSFCIGTLCCLAHPKTTSSQQSLVITGKEQSSMHLTDSFPESTDCNAVRLIANNCIMQQHDTIVRCTGLCCSQMKLLQIILVHCNATAISPTASSGLQEAPSNQLQTVCTCVEKGDSLGHQ
jgi:hypothetical protein